MKNVPELMTTPQVAEILGVTRKTIWMWSRDGIMQPAATTSSKRPLVLFDSAEVARMASVLRVTAEAEAERKKLNDEQHEARRLERLIQAAKTNPAGVAKAQRLTALRG